MPRSGLGTVGLHLLPTVTVEVIAWLDVGQPDRAKAARRIEKAIWAVVEAARSRADD
jgi:hypothetical protein